MEQRKWKHQWLIIHMDPVTPLLPITGLLLTLRPTQPSPCLESLEKRHQMSQHLQMRFLMVWPNCCYVTCCMNKHSPSFPHHSHASRWATDGVPVVFLTGSSMAAGFSSLRESLIKLRQIFKQAAALITHKLQGWSANAKLYLAASVIKLLATVGIAVAGTCSSVPYRTALLQTCWRVCDVLRPRLHISIRFRSRIWTEHSTAFIRFLSSGGLLVGEYCLASWSSSSTCRLARIHISLSYGESSWLWSGEGSSQHQTDISMLYWTSLCGTRV